MRRRAFIAGLGSAAAWPLAAYAQQQPDRVWRVGYLSAVSATNVGIAIFDAFRLKLNDLGYVEGRNLDLFVRRANDDYSRLPGLASELVSLAPDVIVSAANISTLALQRATSSIPIVMATSTDPIGMGFVKSLAKPGGNITGRSNQMFDAIAKSLELLHVAVPNAKRIAVLRTLYPGHEGMVKEAYSAARTLGLTIIPVMARTPDDSDAFATMHSENCDALFVLPHPLMTRRIVELANERRLPAIYQAGVFVDMGGLMSYSAITDFQEEWRQAAVYVDRILKGANPADLPVQQPTKFELEINLKTAKALGLTIPDSIVARADKVIE